MIAAVMLMLALYMGEEDLEGPSKMCLYNANGVTHVITLPDFRVCPLTIQVEGL